MLLLLPCATSEDNLDGLPSLILSMALVLWKSLLEILLIRDMDSHPVFFNDHWQFQTLIFSSLLFPALPDFLYGSCGHGSQAWGNSPTSQNALLQLGYIHPTFIKPPWLRSPLGYYVMPWTFYTSLSSSLVYWEAEGVFTSFFETFHASSCNSLDQIII